MPEKKSNPTGGKKTRVDPKNVYISGTSREAAGQAPAKAKGQGKGKKGELQSAGQASEQFEDEELAKQVAAGVEFFKQLNKGFKQIALYRHNVAQYDEYMERTYKVLCAILQKWETMPLRVEQLGFKFKDAWLYQEDASEHNIAHKFYRDGVRILVFRSGLSAQELLDFILICLTNFRSTEYIHDDMVSLMWKQEFASIEYVVVDSVSVGTESEEEARVEIDKIVNFLYNRLTSKSADHVAFARISLEDLDIELEDVEQAKGVVIKGQPASKDEKVHIQEQIDEEDENRLLPKLVVIMFKVLEEELDQDLGQALEEVFIQLLDSFLIHEDFRGINQMLRKFKTMGRKKLPQGNLARIQGIETAFTSRMGEAERLDQVSQIIDAMAVINDPQEVYRYLTRLDDQAMVPLLQALERMERQEARRLVCDALATLGRGQLDVFVRRLESKKANLVRDMVYVIDKLNPVDKLKILARLLDHPNLAIRLETLRTLGSSGEDTCRAYVMKALSDGDMQMRIMAARMLPNYDLSLATKTLLSICSLPDFNKRHAKEQTAIYAALASTNTADAMEWFREQLRATSLISKKKLSEAKRIVVNGLALSGSIAAFKLLKAELEAGIKEEDVAEAAERACGKLRERLLGS
jgi:hypothetical protein